MAKDKRVKGCPNENCERHEKNINIKLPIDIARFVVNH